METVPFDIGTKHYELTLNTRVIREFEQKIGKGVFEITLGANITETITLLYYAAKTNAKNPNIQLDKFFELVPLTELARVSEALDKCLKVSFGWNEDAQDEPGGERPLDSSTSSAT